MWQTPHTRHPQPRSRRRNLLGLLACLLAVLFAGVLIGRLSVNRLDASDQVYLNNTAPPSATAPTPSASGSPRKPRSNVESRARRTVKTTSTPRPTVQARRKPTGTVEPGVVRGEVPGDPTTVLGAPLLEVSPTLAAQVVRLTNAERVRKGCAPLRVDRRLTSSARAHSVEMAESGRFAHDSPDGSSPWRRMERAGYRDGAAENIGRGYSSAEEAVRGWMGSPAHRRNLLHCGYRAVGVGVVSGPGGPWWTQDFGFS
ncbi:CAP domain-containing protein [Nonomuraea sp. NPDC003804]|uniref:CAP domain-containing protein n=1 Tax=Nonomuraea sp. NPDC003804 TaxID=3154547 RepID=UPI0033AACBAF